jgi:hypothetical protein
VTSREEAWFSFCHRLHDRIANQLKDASSVRARVASLLGVNSFRESCFCKGCVLPVVDSLATEVLCSKFSASRNDIRHARDSTRRCIPATRAKLGSHPTAAATATTLATNPVAARRAAGHRTSASASETQCVWSAK